MSPFRQPKSSARTLGVVHPVPDDEDDAGLVAAIRAGRPGAAARLYDRHVDAVYRLVFRLMGPHSEVDDVVQEVFASALVSLPQLREPAALRYWLLGIGVRAVKTFFRRRWRRRWLTFHPTEELPEAAMTPDHDNSEALREVSAVLDRLPADERIALVLHRVEGLSLQESAAACNTSLATFKRRLSRGETKFFTIAERRSALAGWLEGSTHHDGQ
jgi:RNA polymerase sigma-70 factor (ECF subfamily)